MYKRPARIDPVVDRNSMDYAERGEKCDDECGLPTHFKNDRYLRISRSFLVNICMYALIFMIFFAGLIEMKSNHRKRDIEDSISRRLQEKRPELLKCNRSSSHNASQHVMCYANQARVLIISDSEQDREILEEGKYRDVPMYFMNIQNLFETSSDVIEFLHTFDVQSPWIFVDGSFIGNKHDMIEYHDHNVLETGVKDAPIPPHLNEEEIRLINSQDFPENPHRVRRHLREKFFPPEENKHQQYLKKQLDLLLNHQKTLEHIDMIQKAQSGEKKEYSAHYTDHKD